MAPEATWNAGSIAALVVTCVALIAVWFPFWWGLRACMRAFAVTRKVSAAEIKAALERELPGAHEPISVQVLRVLRSSQKDNPEKMPMAFLIDASRQYVTNEYEANYAKPITMFSNILPPIGFIGTLFGLVVLVLAKGGDGDAMLEMVGLAGAVSKSICALFGFIVLESLKIRVYGRMLAGLDEATGIVSKSVSHGTARKHEAALA
jgi:biopolymer transport protein ExbB